MLKGLTSFVTHEVRESLRRRMMVAAFWAGAIVVALIGIVFVLVAIWQSLAMRWDPVTASLFIAGGALVVMLVLIGVAMYVGRERPRKQKLASTAVVAAPVAMSLARSRGMWTVASLALVTAVGALIGRQVFRQ